MTTTMAPLSPMVRRAYRLLAQQDAAPGSSYSPESLMILRWLVWRPGSTAELITRVQDRQLHDTTRLLLRLHHLRLVKATETARWSVLDTGRWLVQPETRWWLNKDGRSFVELIEREVIV